MWMAWANSPGRAEIFLPRNSLGLGTPRGDLGIWGL